MHQPHQCEQRLTASRIIVPGQTVLCCRCHRQLVECDCSMPNSCLLPTDSSEKDAGIQVALTASICQMTHSPVLRKPRLRRVC